MSKSLQSKMLHMKSSTGDEELQRNFAKLNCSSETGNKTDESARKSKSLSPRISNQLSMNTDKSSGGASQYSSQVTPPVSQAHTAPTASGNYCGFAYPYPMHYPNNYVYTNNNQMVLPATSMGDKNAQYLSAQAHYARSLSPLPNVVPTTVDGTASKYPADTRPILSRSPQPVVPPRPVGYRNNTVPNNTGNMMYMPHLPAPASPHPVNHRTLIDSSNSGMCSPPPPTIPESPENSASFHVQDNDHPREHNGSINAPQKDLNSQIYVNIDSDDSSTSTHDWRPYQSQSHCSQQLVQSMPFQFNPGFNNYQPMFHLPDGSLEQQQGIPQTQMYLPLPYPTMPYPPTPNFYYQIPTSGQFFIPNYEMNVQQHVYQQRHYLNVLQFDLNKEKEEIETQRKEIAELEMSLKENSFLPNKAEIDKLNMEISKLRLECYCLCAEVDEHYKGTVPLGELDEDFYSCINTGQSGPLHSGRRKGHTEAEHPVKTDTRAEDENDDDVSSWTCSACTFRNHPAISVCEVCQIGKNIACTS